MKKAQKSIKPQRIKLTIHINKDTHADLCRFLKENDGITLTYIHNQALKMWLKNPIMEPNATERKLEDLKEKVDEVRKQDEDFAFEEDEGEDCYTTRFD